MKQCHLLQDYIFLVQNQDFDENFLRKLENSKTPNSKNSRNMNDVISKNCWSHATSWYKIVKPTEIFLEEQKISGFREILGVAWHLQKSLEVCNFFRYHVLVIRNCKTDREVSCSYGKFFAPGFPKKWHLHEFSKVSNTSYSLEILFSWYSVILTNIFGPFRRFLQYNLLSVKLKLLYDNQEKYVKQNNAKGRITSQSLL